MSARASEHVPDEWIESFRERLLAWYRAHGRLFPWRHADATLYLRVLSEVLLQRTPAERVGGFVEGFVAQYPDWKALAEAKIEDLGEELRPLGLWRRRAESIHALATEVFHANGTLPQDRTALESLPGVGQYIANAIDVIAHGGAAPFLDSNMARVLERVFGPRAQADIRYDPYLQSLAHRATAAPDSLAVNFAVLDHAAVTCTIRRPQCEACVVADLCRSAGTFD